MKVCQINLPASLGKRNVGNESGEHKGFCAYDEDPA